MSTTVREKSTRQKRPPVTSQDHQFVQSLLARCVKETRIYCKGICEAANKVCDFEANNKALQFSDENSSFSDSAECETGFANSKGSVSVLLSTSFSDNSYSNTDNNRSDESTGHKQTTKRTFSDLIIWLRQSGAEVDNINVHESGEAGFAVHCEKDVRKSDSIVKVPFSCLITDTMATKAKTGKILLRSQEKLAALAHCQLSVFLLEDMERGKNSRYHAYYASLPKNLPQHALFWTSEEKKFLRGSCFLDDVHSFEIMVENDYKTIISCVPAFRRFSLSQFLWSRIIVSSRNFSIRINQVDHIAMVPLADMMNHHEPRRTSWEYNNSLQVVPFLFFSLYTCSSCM